MRIMLRCPLELMPKVPVDLPGLLRELDELADGSCRQRRMHDQRLRADAERSDRNEIVERIVRELAVDVRP
jgi:hypothetical protein